MPIRVMLVDDHPIVREGYARLIGQSNDITVVAEAGNAEEALECLRKGALPNVAVIDLSMPGGGRGIELIGRIRTRLPSCRVIVFSMHDSPALVQRAFDVGALGFLSKSSTPDILLQAIRSVHSGVRATSPGLLVDTQGSDENDRLARLSARELALFTLLAEGRSIAECAAELNLSTKTASNYQTNLREKLGVSTTAAMTHLALRCGLIKSPLP